MSETAPRGCFSDVELGLSVADDLVAGLLSDRVYDHVTVRGLADSARNDDLLLGDAHAAELDGQPLQRGGAAGGLGLRARNLRHGPETVQDPPGKTNRFGELLVDVDRVEVAGRSRITVGQVLVGGDAQL